MNADPRFIKALRDLLFAAENESGNETLGPSIRKARDVLTQIEDAALSPAPLEALDVDKLAQEIRRVDGSKSLGAGALAEALMPFLYRALSPAPPVAETIARHEFIERVPDAIFCAVCEQQRHHPAHTPVATAIPGEVEKRLRAAIEDYDGRGYSNLPAIIITDELAKVAGEAALALRSMAEALEPFAAQVKALEPDPSLPDDTLAYATLGDFRRAARAISQGAPEK